MIKKDIVNLITLNKIVLENKKYEDILLPDHKELNSEFEILKKEIDTGKNTLQEANKMIKSYNCCNHLVRLEYSCFLRSDSECVLCGKPFLGDCHVNGGTIYDDTNRNRYVVMFRGNFFDDDEIYCFDGYDKNDVYDILLKVLEEKNDDDEIDFVQEIKKLNISKCRIDERRKERIYYILIVGGSNKQNISNHHYITSDKITISSDFACFLSCIPGVRLEMFDNDETYKTKKFTDCIDTSKSRNTRFVSYTTVSDLMKEINSERNVPFDIIIDMSSLYEYCIGIDGITSKKIDINFKEIFPNSYVIKFDNYGNRSQKELLEILKKKLIMYNESYVLRVNKNIFGNTNNDDFYLINGDSLETADVQEIYKNIKRVLSKR